MAQKINQCHLKSRKYNLKMWKPPKEAHIQLLSQEKVIETLGSSHHHCSLEHFRVSLHSSTFLNDTITFCFCLSHWESSSFLCICVTCRCWELSAGNIKWIYQVPILTAIGVRVLHLLLPINAAWKFTWIHFCKKGQSSIISLQAFEFLACNLKGLKFPSMNTNNLLLSMMKHQSIWLSSKNAEFSLITSEFLIFGYLKFLIRELWFHALDAVTTRWNCPIKANKISSFVT